MPNPERHAVTPVCDVHIVREPKPDSMRYEVDTYVPERDADAVRHFACWKTSRGWMIFCFASSMDYRSNPAPLLGDFYAPKRRPDVQGSIHNSALGLGSFRTYAIWKTRGPYAASPADIRGIYRAIFAD